jgi:hypothetical protein
MSVSRLVPASLVFIAAFAAPASAQQNVVVNCESVGGRQQYCEVETRYGVRLVDDLSRGRCREGSTWGADGRGIWVTGGCRGAFELGAGDAPIAGYDQYDRYDQDRKQDPYARQDPYNRYDGQQGNAGYGVATVLCESKDNRRRHCRADVRGGRVVLIRNISRTQCAEGHNWGWDDAGVWVDQGCRGEFGVEAGGGYARYGAQPYGYGGPRQGIARVRCESRDHRRAFCGAAGGNVVLVQQVSDAACIEGRTWGFDGRRIWVDQGCAGEFEVVR